MRQLRLREGADRQTVTSTGARRLEPEESFEIQEQRLECLERCLQELNPNQRALVCCVTIATSAARRSSVGATSGDLRSDDDILSSSLSAILHPSLKHIRRSDFIFKGGHQQKQKSDQQTIKAFVSLAGTEQQFERSTFLTLGYRDALVSGRATGAGYRRARRGEIRDSEAGARRGAAISDVDREPAARVHDRVAERGLRRVEKNGGQASPNFTYT